MLRPELALHELPPLCLHIQLFPDTRIQATRVPACRTQNRRALSSRMQLMEIKSFSEDVRRMFSKYSNSFCKIMTPLISYHCVKPLRVTKQQNQICERVK